jgi:hypothetical protein
MKPPSDEEGDLAAVHALRFPKKDYLVTQRSGMDNSLSAKAFQPRPRGFRQSCCHDEGRT